MKLGNRWQSAHGDFGKLKESAMAAMSDRDFRQAAETALTRAADIDQRHIKRALGDEFLYVACVIGKSDQHALDWLDRMKITSYYPKITQLRKVPHRQLSRAQRASGIEILRPTLTPMFPRYVFVKLRTGDDWGEISRFAGIGGMWCEGGIPVRVRDADLQKIRKRECSGAVPGSESVRVLFAIGDEVRVIDGPFASFPGIVEKGLDMAIEDVDPRERIKVVVNIFGRATPVELEVWQVAKQAAAP
jgi:transcription termination/antitermination protein NusG